MTPERHARIKKIFIAASELGPEERPSFLERACSGDGELRREVESLLGHHYDNTLIEGSVRALVPRAPSALHATSAVSEDPTDVMRAGSLAQRLFGTRARRALVLILLGGILVGGSAGAHALIRQSLEEHRSEELRALLTLAEGGLDLWIRDRKRGLEDFARQPEVPILVAQALDPEVTETALRAFDDELARRVRREIEVDTVEAVLVDPSGNIVLDTGTPSLRGQLILSTEIRKRLASARSTGAFFLPPIRGPREAGSAFEQRREPQRVWFAIPFIDSEGGLLGTLGYSVAVREEFSILLGDPIADGELRTYVFDLDGRLLSGDSKLLPREIHDSVISAAKSIDQGPKDASGVFLKPYTGTGGRSVIGAWVWLADHNIAIATEMAEEEAFRTIRLFRATLGGFVTLLFASVALWFGASRAVVRLRGEVGKARQLGQYTLGKKIGEGGMGDVYLGHHALLKRPTAIKIMRPTVPRAYERFRTEVRLASQLTHPNTIAIYDYGRTDDGTFYYAMEYLEGLNLTEAIAIGGPMPESRVIHILRQIAGSLAEAHSKGLIHRDIKPSNIMLCYRGGELDVVKVLDFGLAKDLRATPSASHEGIQGTPRYMAPERIRDPRGVDARADVFAMGALTYYLLTASHAFDGGTDDSILSNIASGALRRPSEHTQQPVSEELEAIVLCALDPDTTRRFADARELIEALEKIQDVPPWTKLDAEMWWSEQTEGLLADVSSEVSTKENA